MWEEMAKELEENNKTVVRIMGDMTESLQHLLDKITTIQESQQERADILQAKILQIQETQYCGGIYPFELALAKVKEAK